MAKLAKKGKKVKLIDESGSVKELPHQEDSDMEREMPSSVKKKFSKIKKQRDEEEGLSAKKLIE